MPEGFDITLDTIGGGVASELFERELAIVLQNIQDPNTSAKKARKIKIEVIIAPTEDRQQATVGVTASSDVAPAKTSVSTLYMARRGGRIVAVGYDPRQEELLPQAGVTPLPVAHGAEGASQ